MKTFIALLNYTRPEEEVDQVLDAHRAYLDRYFASGHFLMCGRQVPRTGGLILGRAESRREMESILREDPFYTEQVAEFHLVEFNPTKWADGFEGFKAD